MTTTLERPTTTGVNVAEIAIEQLRLEALEIQDACNSCGLAQRFAEVMLELHRNPLSTGTDWVNQHGVVRLWLSKLCDLARIEVLA